jgi:hypothetical protein
MSGEVHLFSTFCLITKPYLSGSGSRARPAPVKGIVTRQMCTYNFHVTVGSEDPMVILLQGIHELYM